jgi:truncated hemoglobin YjbI
MMLSLYDKVGGRPVLEKLVKRFYDKVFAHPWLGLYFKNVKQTTIELQQVEFMIGALGGPRIYMGKIPGDAHPHMMITNELFDLRQKLMLEALKEENSLPELTDRWLKIEEAFREKIVKTSIDKCQVRFFGDEILDFIKTNKAS